MREFDTLVQSYSFNFPKPMIGWGKIRMFYLFRNVSSKTLNEAYNSFSL